MNARDIAGLSDQKLIRAAIMSLAFGALPIEDWGHTFASTADEGPETTEELRNLAFIVWLPTATDFLLTAGTRTVLRAQAEKRGLACGDIFALANDLAEHFHSVLALLTREEQIFIRDRRWQSIYGNSYFLPMAERVKVSGGRKRRLMLPLFPS